MATVITEQLQPRGSIRPYCNAITASWVRSAAPNLSLALTTWVFTVSTGDVEAAADALVGEAAGDACHQLKLPLDELFNQRRQIRMRGLSRTELANLSGR